MLRRVERRLPLDKANGLPRGVQFNRGAYIANIYIDGKMWFLGTRHSMEEAGELYADAAEAAAKGEFDDWLKRIKAENKKRRYGKRKMGSSNTRSE